MRVEFTARTALVAAAAMLSACADGPTSPVGIGHANAVSATLGTCGNFQQQSAQALGEGYPLPGITIVATFSAGVPFWLTQRMNYSGGSGGDVAPCLSDGNVTFTVDEPVAEIYPPLPVPDGVDPNFWASLSPREQRALMAYARALMELNPGRYRTPGQAIVDRFQTPILENKVRAKLTGNDYFPGEPDKAELFAGAAFGAQLYEALTGSADWQLGNAETLKMVSELAAAWAEAQYQSHPLTGVRFAANAAMGAAIAAQPGNGTSLVRRLFEAVGGTINVTNPYATAGGGSTPPGGGGGSLMPDWY